MKLIELTKGYYTEVDDDYIRTKEWCYSHGYAVRGTQCKGKQTRIYMHREIIGAQPGEYVDHINGDRLDNRRSNLRICTHKENMQGFRKIKGK